MRRPTLQVAILSVAFALATVVLGWWAVPVLAGVWGVVARVDERPAVVAALGAGLGWILLLVWTAAQGPAGELAQRAAGVMGIPSALLFLITVLFPMMIAWGAAVLGETITYRRPA